MVILEIISLCILAILLIIVSIMAVKKSPNNTMTLKDYMELREYIKLLFNEQNKVNKTINDLIVQNMALNNDSVINAVSKNAGLQTQTLNDIMARLNKLMESTAQSMQNATLVLQSGLERLQNDNEKKYFFIRC